MNLIQVKEELCDCMPAMKEMCQRTAATPRTWWEDSATRSDFWGPRSL